MKPDSVKIYDPNAPHAFAVTLTDAAVLHVKSMIAKRGHGIGMRLSLKTTGCSGYSYVVDFVDEPIASDRVFALEDGLSLYVEAASYDMVQGTVIDYVKKGINETFIYQNPNQTGECGCGESFSIDQDS